MRTPKKSSREDLVQDLKALGLTAGDTVLVRGDLGKIGRTQGSPADTILGALLDVIGPDGTLIGLAFTEQFIRFLAKPSYTFDVDTPSKSGGLARIMLSHPHMIRSRHPVNSFVGIGKEAAYILEGHDETQHGYLPVERIVALNGKMLIFGCVDNSPGFTTVHLAQEKLGLAYRTPFRNLFGVHYRKDNEVRLFTRRSIGGCSRGFGRFYSDYVKRGILQTGTLGNAYALQVPAAEAFEVEKTRLIQEPTYALCEDKDCPMCRGMWWYNWKDMPGFFIRNSLKVLRLVLPKKIASAKSL